MQWSFANFNYKSFFQFKLLLLQICLINENFLSQVCHNFWHILVFVCSFRLWHSINPFNHPLQALNVGHLGWLINLAQSIIQSQVTGRWTSLCSTIYCSIREPVSCEYDCFYMHRVGDIKLYR